MEEWKLAVIPAEISYIMGVVKRKLAEPAARHE